MLGSSITWRAVNAPFTPDAGNGAIAGGPGADPNPGTPMYICRARVQGSLVPGKWVQGNCNVAFGGSEQIMRSYEVAYGSARWGAYRGSEITRAIRAYEAAANVYADAAGFRLEPRLPTR